MYIRKCYINIDILLSFFYSIVVVPLSKNTQACICLLCTLGYRFFFFFGRSRSGLKRYKTHRIFIEINVDL
ncbi:hypothetical protein HanPI659440_Chr03g0100751 [Helianthus annuus]|nr:hypothetical protein HanPI659440_Chr03g0100751 [Helianthus annuus]